MSLTRTSTNMSNVSGESGLDVLALFPVSEEEHPSFTIRDEVCCKFFAGVLYRV